jgi:hypothetical protein
VGEVHAMMVASGEFTPSQDVGFVAQVFGKRLNVYNLGFRVCGTRLQV